MGIFRDLIKTENSCELVNENDLDILKYHQVIWNMNNLHFYVKCKSGEQNCRLDQTIGIV